MIKIVPKKIIIILFVQAILIIVLLILLWNAYQSNVPIIIKPIKIYKQNDYVVLDFMSNKNLAEERHTTPNLACYFDENQAEILYNPSVNKENIRVSFSDYVQENSDTEYYYRISLFPYDKDNMSFYNNMMTCHIVYIAMLFGETKYSLPMQISTKLLNQY